MLEQQLIKTLEKPFHMVYTALRFLKHREDQPKKYKFTNMVRNKLELKPIFPYLELHLADHCNLRCRGCSHFSPIAERKFADINRYRKDLKQLSQLVSNIKIIRLLGGEPLLHPNINAFISTTRENFPRSNIHIVTNGILLPTMEGEFWQVCQQNSVIIDLTIYPPFLEKEQSWIRLVKSHKLRLNCYRVKEFINLVNIKGDSEEIENFKQCRKKFYCPMLREGKIYNCFFPALVHFFNKKCGVNIPNGEHINIHNPRINGWDILKKIDASTQTCRYCTAGWKEVPHIPWVQQK